MCGVATNTTRCRKPKQNKHVRVADWADPDQSKWQMSFQGITFRELPAQVWTTKPGTPQNAKHVWSNISLWQQNTTAKHVTNNIHDISCVLCSRARSSFRSVFGCFTSTAHFGDPCHLFMLVHGCCFRTPFFSQIAIAFDVTVCMQWHAKRTLRLGSQEDCLWKVGAKTGRRFWKGCRKQWKDGHTVGQTNNHNPFRSMAHVEGPQKHMPFDLKTSTHQRGEYCLGKGLQHGQGEHMTPSGRGRKTHPPPFTIVPSTPPYRSTAVDCGWLSSVQFCSTVTDTHWQPWLCTSTNCCCENWIPNLETVTNLTHGNSCESRIIYNLQLQLIIFRHNLIDAFPLFLASPWPSSVVVTVHRYEKTPKFFHLLRLTIGAKAPWLFDRICGRFLPAPPITRQPKDCDNPHWCLTPSPDKLASNGLAFVVKTNFFFF